MRLAALCFALALAACGGEKTTTKPGDPVAPGDPRSSAGDTTPGDPGTGDTAPGDPGQGDQLPGDPGPGDPGGGDPIAAVITPSTQFCASGGKVSSSSYSGTVCLSPLGSGGLISTSSSYKWIPGPAHIVEAQ